MEYINVYAPTKKETQLFLTPHNTLDATFLAGYFNAHHPGWYVELATARSGVIRASSRAAEFLVDWTTLHHFEILNMPGTYTYFPRSNYLPTITDRTFVRGGTAELLQSWSYD